MQHSHYSIIRLILGHILPSWQSEGHSNETCSVTLLCPDYFVVWVVQTSGLKLPDLSSEMHQALENLKGVIPDGANSSSPLMNTEVSHADFWLGPGPKVGNGSTLNSTLLSNLNMLHCLPLLLLPRVITWDTIMWGGELLHRTCSMWVSITFISCSVCMHAWDYREKYLQRFSLCARCDPISFTILKLLQCEPGICKPIWGRYH